MVGSAKLRRLPWARNSSNIFFAACHCYYKHEITRIDIDKQQYGVITNSSVAPGAYLADWKPSARHFTEFVHC